MEKYILRTIILGTFITFFSCTDLEIFPPSKPATEDWYTSEMEIEMALNFGYSMNFWKYALDNTDDNDKWDDDWVFRNSLSAITGGSLNGETGFCKTIWSNRYQAIASANLVIENLKRAEELKISEAKVIQYRAEASFLRACFYMTLVTHWGDVPYITTPINVDEAFSMGRTPLADIKPQIYADFDVAINGLPVSYAASAQTRATKGAALAMKARCALYLGDYAIAAEAAKACMDLGIYELHADFSDLFLSKTKRAEESIFIIPRSLEFGAPLKEHITKNFLPRNCGGYNSVVPTFQLFASFLCTDGLPIHESPLFDPHAPFKNRDPRCAATILPFGTNWLGYVYDPHPKALTVWSDKLGTMVQNNDCRTVNQYTSFTALCWRKGADETYMQNGNWVDPDLIIIRYADVLLMYAEAKIELNQIDQTVLDAINEVRARAYGVDKSATTQYPAVTSTDQVELRKTIRFERRMEFATEGLRLMDLMRWRLATKALSDKNYGPLYPYPDSKLDDWFWPKTPSVDEDGIADFSEMEKAGDILVLSAKGWNDRQYLWPIPSSEIIINPNMEQNPGY